jgi:hypothetical protein
MMNKVIISKNTALIAVGAFVTLGVAVFLLNNMPEAQRAEIAQAGSIKEPLVNNSLLPPPLTEPQVQALMMSTSSGADSASTDSASTSEDNKEYLSNLENIVRLIDNLEHISMFEMQSIIDKLKEDPSLRREWLYWLKTESGEGFSSAIKHILSAMPNKELVPFLRDAIETRDTALVNLSINTLWYMDETNPIQGGIVGDPVDLISQIDDQYIYANATDILINREIDYTEEDKHRLSLAFAEDAYNENLDIKFTAIKGQLSLGSMTKIEQEAAVIEQLTHNDTKVRSKALAYLDYWLEAGYQPSADAKNRLVNQVIADYSDMDDIYIRNVAYLLSSLELTAFQTTVLEAAGVALEGE